MKGFFGRWGGGVWPCALLLAFLPFSGAASPQDSTRIAIQEKMADALMPVVQGAGPAPAWIILVRHAEKAAGEGDVSLSDAGRERVRALAAFLSEVPLDAIYSTNWKRNRDTAEPVAKAKRLPVTTLSTEAGAEAHARDLAAILASGNHAGRSVLCVEHSNTIPMLLRALGVENVPEEAQYSQLFLVAPALTQGGLPRLVILHYGPPESANAAR